MGAAAFLIAAYLGKSYWYIVLVGFTPALLFYATTALSVYYLSRQYLKGIAVKLERDPLRTIFRDLSPLVVAIVVLLVFLSQLYDPLIAASRAVITLMAASLVLYFFKFYRNGGLPLTLTEYFKGFMNGIVNGAEIAATTAAMLATIMIIVSVLNVSGLGVKLSMGLVYLAGGSLFLLCLYSAIVCIVFGFGVSATAAYLLTIIIAAPAFIAVGVNPLNAHFYVFYFSILSAITPPVAIAAVVASRISGAPFIALCIESIKIGLPLFILPAIFIMYPEILAVNIQTLKIAAFLLIAFWGLSLGIRCRALPREKRLNHKGRFLPFGSLRLNCSFLCRMDSLPNSGDHYVNLAFVFALFETRSTRKVRKKGGIRSNLIGRIPLSPPLANAMPGWSRFFLIKAPSLFLPESRKV